MLIRKVSVIKVEKNYLGIIIIKTETDLEILQWLYYTCLVRNKNKFSKFHCILPQFALSSLFFDFFFKSSPCLLTKTMLSTQKSVPRSSRQMDLTKTS